MSEIIYGLSNESYHYEAPYSEYISSSALKKYIISPKSYQHSLDNPDKGDCDTLRFGSLFHDLMASLAGANGMWAQGYSAWLDGLARFAPPINESTGAPYGASTKVYTKAYQQFIVDNESKTIVNTTDSDLASDMAHSLLNDCGATSDQVRKLLKWGNPEVSIFHESENGIKIKVRPDLLTNKKIIDWKTTASDNLGEESINRSILKYGYHISAAMYQWVVHEVLGKWLDFYEVFVSKVPPYDAVMVNMANYGYRYLPDVDMVIPGCGALEFKRLLDLHTKCTKENHWPGAESFIPGDKYRIMDIEPPRWYSNRFLEE